MAKYVAKHKGEEVSAISVAGVEYKAKDGKIDVPDGHSHVHRELKERGFERAE